jgi:hypothetical protein
METLLLLMAIFLGVIAVANLILLGGLAYLAVTIKKLLETSVKPTVENVNSLVAKVENKADHIMNVGVKTAEQVSRTITKIADLVQQAVTPPLIKASSILAGISQAWKTWRRS